MAAGAVLLLWDRRAFRALTLGEEAAREPRLRSRPHSPARRDRCRGGGRRRRRGRRLDRLHRAGRAASDAALRRLRSGPAAGAGGALRRGAAACRRHRGASHPVAGRDQGRRAHLAHRRAVLHRADRAPPLRPDRRQRHDRAAAQAEPAHCRFRPARVLHDVALSVQAGRVRRHRRPERRRQDHPAEGGRPACAVARRGHRRRRRRSAAVARRTGARGSPTCRRATSFIGRCRSRDVVGLGRLPRGAGAALSAADREAVARRWRRRASSTMPTGR